MENANNGASDKVRENVRYYGSLGGTTLSERIAHLDREWDAEKAFRTVAAGLGAAGLVFGLFGARSWRLFTWISLPMLFLNSLGRWVPPVEGLRRMGLRTRREIEEEKYALKALRGDFKGVGEMPMPEGDSLTARALRALEAVET